MTVKFFELFDAGRTHTVPAHADTWQGGDVSFVMGQADPRKKEGVMTTEGNLAKGVKDNGAPTRTACSMTVAGNLQTQLLFCSPS